MFNNNSEEFHVNSTRLDPERLGRYPFTIQGLYQVVLFGMENIIICLGTGRACVGKGCEPQVLLAIWDSSDPPPRAGAARGWFSAWDVVPAAAWDRRSLQVQRPSS